MNVDGPTPNGSTVPSALRPSQRISPKRPSALSRPARNGAPSAPEKGTRANQAPSKSRDTYEHISTDPARPATYREIAPAETQVLNASFDALQESVQESYSAEIVDLETASNANGLPLRPVEDTPGVLKQDILRAYRKGEEEKGATIPNSPPDALDTIG